MIIFTWKLAHIVITMYEFQINHEKFDVIIFYDVSKKGQNVPHPK